MINTETKSQSNPEVRPTFGAMAVSFLETNGESLTNVQTAGR